MYVDGPNGIDDNGDGETDEPKERDRFITHQPEYLVPQADGFYFTEREGGFIRYRRVGGHWEGRRPDGVLLEFGLTGDARVWDPETGRVFAWNLERETDRNGNTIDYFYQRFPGAENLNQSYLVRIEYGSGSSPRENKHIIRFDYESRPDWFETGRPRFLVRTGMRLTGIAIATQGPELEGHAAGDLDADGVTDYLDAEVLPYVPDAWVDHDKTKIGYEIPVSRQFYVYVPPRPLKEIDAEIEGLEGEILDLLREVSQ